VAPAYPEAGDLQADPVRSAVLVEQGGSLRPPSTFQVDARSFSHVVIHVPERAVAEHHARGDRRRFESLKPGPALLRGAPSRGRAPSASGVPLHAARHLRDGRSGARVSPESFAWEIAVGEQRGCDDAVAFGVLATVVMPPGFPRETTSAPVSSDVQQAE